MKIFVGYYIDRWDKIMEATGLFLFLQVPSFFIKREKKEYGDNKTVVEGYFPTKEDRPFMIIYFM